MKNLFVIIIALFMMAAVKAPIAYASEKGKPQLPVEVAIGMTNAAVTVEPGASVDITVSGTARTAVTAMRIEARLLDGTELVSGELVWSGPSGKGETRSMHFTVKVPSTGTGRITATVTLLKDGKPVAERRGQFVLQTEQEKQAEKPAVRTGKDSSGRDIIEY